MAAPAQSSDELRAAARAAIAAGDRGAAGAAWAALLDVSPGDAEAANALGNLALGSGEAVRARALFEVAARADPGQPALLFNLSAAARACGDTAAALDALNQALVADPYFVQALFQKGVLLDEAGDARNAANVFRDFLDTVPAEIADDPRFAAPLAHAREAVKRDGAALATGFEALGASPSRRVRDSIAHLAGQAPIYRSEPTFLSVPELPSIPFLEREATPWTAALEDRWETVRDELQAVLTDESGFVPYVANPPGTPLNQWQELDHNPDWSVLFLWKHSRPDTANQARMPQTTMLLQSLPHLDIPGRGPNAFISRLAPRTRIPPHTGVTNARLTVHLPLIVPENCSFRVGSDTREWLPGTAWVFDDTIEHEARNDSDRHRYILIFDIWHPLLGEAECDHLRAALGAYDRHHRRMPAPGDEF